MLKYCILLTLLFGIRLIASKPYGKVQLGHTESIYLLEIQV